MLPKYFSWNEHKIFKALPTRPKVSSSMKRCLNMQKFEHLASDHLFSKTAFSKYLKKIIITLTVFEVILSVVESCSTAPRLSALPVLSILPVVGRWSWYCCAGRLASPSVTRPARPEPFFNSDKVFQSSKLDCGSRRRSLTSYCLLYTSDAADE